MPVELSAEVRFAVNLPTSRDIQDELLVGMRKAVGAVLGRAKTNLSGRFLKTRTGRGLRSVRTKITSTPVEVTGTIGSPLFYLRMLHVGFPGGVFTTTWGKAFRFLGPGGLIVEAQSINHPGVSARPWLQSALEESQDDILLAFDQAAQSIGRFVAG